MMAALWIVLVLVANTLLALVSWNTLCPEIIPLPEINFFEALAVVVLSAVVFNEGVKVTLKS